MPRTQRALATGELTGSAVQMLVAARHAHPAQFHRSEQALVEAARRLPAPQLHHTVAHWRQRLDWSQGLRDAERLRDQRRLSVSVTMLGTGYHTLEKTLEAQKIHRKIGMRVPSFLGVATLSPFIERPITAALGLPFAKLDVSNGK